MRMSFILILLILCQGEIWGQQVVLRGDVRDIKGHAIKGASISLKDSYDGALTDAAGYFSFVTADISSGLLIIKATAPGFHDQEIQVDQRIGAGSPDSLIVHFCLQESMEKLNAVTVTASSFGGGQSKNGSVVLSSLDVLTTAGANADISKAVNLLPGAQQINNQEGLFVRGGEGYETKQYIDGSLVAHPYYLAADNIPGRGRYPATLFKGFSFSTGGYSALYGQALSSVLSMETVDMPEKSEANGFISPIQNSFGFQQLTKDKKFSWGLNYQYTNLGLYYKLVKQAATYFKVPQFHNVEGNFRIKTKTGILKFYTAFNYNGLGISRPAVDSIATYTAVSLGDYNWWNSLLWKTDLGKGWNLNFNAAFSFDCEKILQKLQDKNARQITTDEPWVDTLNFNLHKRQQMGQSKAVFEKKWGGLSAIRFGAEYLQSKSVQSYQSLRDTLTADFAGSLSDHNLSVFAESETYLSNALVATIGLRYEYSWLLKQADLAPRMAIAYKTGKNAAISAAYGVFYQRPEDLWLMYNPALSSMQACHYILSYEWQRPGKFLRLEAYYKKYRNLVKTWPGYSNSGYGYAKGAELYWRDKVSWKSLDYTVSYTYLDTKRDYLNFPTELVPGIAARHTLSVSLKRFFTAIGTGVSLTHSFATGRPYYNFQLNEQHQYYIADKGRTSGYETLDISVYHLAKMGKAAVIWYASATNLLGSDNISGYVYAYDGQAKQAITAPATRFYFVGLILNWGVDRRQNSIDNL